METCSKFWMTRTFVPEPGNVSEVTLIFLELFYSRRGSF